LPISLVLGDEGDAARALVLRTRPLRMGIVEQTQAFTMGEIGIPTFELDDSLFREFLDRREDILAQSVPSKFRRLSSSLQAGLERDETVQQLRQRIVEDFERQVSPAKALQVARTETASLMNGVRDGMFELQGITQVEWVTSGDEHVREDHVTFGAHGPVPRGFDYLTLDGLTGPTNGVLRRPHDEGAPAGQVVNCRCVQIAVG
ncbi:MAG: hypothetical protein KDA28_01615, partial [Phycisphaerales bacterium]|nr:hypothetical protein [Phycisphaerales bacterium]